MPTMLCGHRFGLRSASGESGADGGGQRLAECSRSATPAAEPQTEARRSCGTEPCKLRDERAICEVEGTWSRGGQGRPVALKCSKSRVGHGGSAGHM